MKPRGEEAGDGRMTEQERQTALADRCSEWLRSNGLPQDVRRYLCNFVTMERGMERREIVAYMAREAKAFVAAGVKLAEPWRKFMEVVGAAIEGLAGFFEDGGHLR